MKKKIFLCITLFVLFFTFSLNVRALEINEVVDAINDWYDEFYKDSAYKDIVTYKAAFDPLENKIKFHFGYTCTGTCDGKILETAENSGQDFYWIYDDEEKSIEYKNDGTVNDKNIYEGSPTLNHVTAVLNKMGYEYVGGIINGNGDFNYDENKFELKTVTIPDGYKTAGGINMSVAHKMINSLKLSIEDISIPGVEKTEVTQDDEKKENESNTANTEINKENKKNSVENPKTSDMNMYFVILPILGFSVLTFFGIKRIIKLKKI